MNSKVATALALASPFALPNGGAMVDPLVLWLDTKVGRRWISLESNILRSSAGCNEECHRLAQLGLRIVGFEELCPKTA